MRFIEKASKSIQDADGFYTDYTMYFDTENEEYVFVFGDKDIYLPETEDFDWQCDSETEAWDWFNSYEGFEEDEYCPSSTNGDYSPSNPWNAPGMSISDFI